MFSTSPTTVCQSPKFLVANICDLPDVINCQFHLFAVAPLSPVHFLLPDWQSRIHCLIISRIWLSTPNNLGGAWRRICLLDIRSVSSLELWRCSRNRALQIDVYLLTYLITYYYVLPSFIQYSRHSENLWLTLKWVINVWNALPVDVIDFGSIKRFRCSLLKVELSSFTKCSWLSMLY